MSFQALIIHEIAEIRLQWWTKGIIEISQNNEQSLTAAFQARVTLARAVYSFAEILLLDDVSPTDFDSIDRLNGSVGTGSSGRSYREVDC